MNAHQAVARLSDVIRRKHLALNTEQTYCAWLRRYCQHIDLLPAERPSEQKLAHFLTALSKTHITASTQNQALNAIIFFYKEVLGTQFSNIQSLRARRPAHLRHAPAKDEVLLLLKTVQAQEDFAVSLGVSLLYGCGLRVAEPLELRIKDVNPEGTQFVIRGAKGGKDRVVQIPCSVIEDLRQQVESARIIWNKDRLSQTPLALPHQLAAKYPQAQFDWKWAWLFPAHRPCLDPRSGKLVRWRLHEVNLQRAVQNACRKTGLSILPHELRHAYATHCRNRGANPRAIQQVMGHKSLETTMGYLHAEAMSVASPLDAS